MIFEVLGAAVLGLAIALAAVRRLPGRFPTRSLTLATGPGAAVFGALLAHTVLGPGWAPAVLLVAVGVCAALLSLLLRPEPRPARRLRRSATA
ncbi:hypothetical protein [Streptomyces sp. CA-132043]|uniref:hypothetical protein n=1 Tax=Streptomyces sp. CA-132043 TaxID=3240048 RepID=UPI003D8D5783